MHEKQNRILAFWFGEDPLKPLANLNLWFTRNESFDREVRDRFEPLLEDAVTGAFDDWVKTARGALALVILTDQMPRNMYRDDTQAFAFDSHALRASQIAIDHGLNQSLSTVERCFLYLPFEHSENIDIQNRSLELFRSLANHADLEEKTFIDMAIDYAVRHHEIIETFGRFPHRNDVLGRESTRREREFLKRPGAYF